MEEVARGGIVFGAGPQRDRQQHHVHRAEGGDAERAQEALLLQKLDAVGGLRGERKGRVAERLEPLEDDRRLEGALVPFDGHAPVGEIDPRAAHAGLSAEPLLDRDDAGPAVDPVDHEIHRGDAVGGVTHEVRQVLRFRHGGPPS